MASELNFKHEMKRAFKRLPLVAVVVTVVLGGFIAVGVGVMAVVVLQFGSNPQADQAKDALEKGVGRAQSVIGLADCLTGNWCPGDRTATDDAASLVEKVSTINGTTFTDPEGDDWTRWGAALMRYGRLEQDTVKRISGTADRGKETIQVTNSEGTTMICDLAWSKDQKLSTWQCYSQAPTPSSTRRRSDR